MSNRIDVRELRAQRRAAERRERKDMRAAHERGLQAVREGGSYRTAFAMKLHGTPPPLPPGPGMPFTGGPNPCELVDDPLYGQRAVLERGRTPYYELDPEPFDWRTLSH